MKNYIIKIFGKKLNGIFGITGIIEGYYTENELITLKNNYVSHGQILSIIEKESL